MAISKHSFINLLFLFFFFFFTVTLFSSKDDADSELIDAKTTHRKALQSDDDNSCVYTVYVRTSKTFSAGTDSIISVALYDNTGSGVLIKDLEAWGGIMGEDYDYYERGNLDIFTGRGPCLDRPVCSMKLMSDGAGEHHGWYCNYVEVTTTGPHLGCAQELFTVEQWLALDRSPHELTAVRDNCDHEEGDDSRLRTTTTTTATRPTTRFGLGLGLGGDELKSSSS